MHCGLSVSLHDVYLTQQPLLYTLCSGTLPSCGIKVLLPGVYR